MCALKNGRKKISFADHPWISFWLLLFFTIVSMIVSGIIYFGILGLRQDEQLAKVIVSLSGYLILLFLVVPYLLHLPYGKRKFKEYLNDIRLLRFGQLHRLITITISCYAILAFFQVLGSFVYRYLEGQPFTSEFLFSVLNIANELPPNSLGVFVSLPSIFEEVIFRGILITLFLSKYSKLKAILFSSLGFALVHIFNLAGGSEPIWVSGQMLWSFMLGIFYGYLFIQTGSLIPCMLFHYISNVFVGTFNSYIQSTASMEIQVLCGTIFTFGFLPVLLMIFWVKYYSKTFPFRDALERI